MINCSAFVIWINSHSELLHMTNLQCMLSFCDLRCFDTISGLSRFTHLSRFSIVSIVISVSNVPMIAALRILSQVPASKNDTSDESLKQFSFCEVCSCVCTCISGGRVCRADGLNEQTWISCACNRNMAGLEHKHTLLSKLFKLFSTMVQNGSWGDILLP